MGDFTSGVNEGIPKCTHCVEIYNILENKFLTIIDNDHRHFEFYKRNNVECELTATPGLLNLSPTDHMIYLDITLFDAFEKINFKIKFEPILEQYLKEGMMLIATNSPKDDVVYGFSIPPHTLKQISNFMMIIDVKGISTPKELQTNTVVKMEVVIPNPLSTSLFKNWGLRL